MGLHTRLRRVDRKYTPKNPISPHAESRYMSTRARARLASERRLFVRMNVCMCTFDSGARARNVLAICLRHTLALGCDGVWCRCERLYSSRNLRTHTEYAERIFLIVLSYVRARSRLRMSTMYITVSYIYDDVVAVVYMYAYTYY